MRNPFSTGRRRAAAAVLAALVAGGLGGTPALAHASVTSGSPAAHAQLSGNPPYVDLRFNSPVVGAELIQLHDSAGRSVRTGATEVHDGGRRIRARIPTLKTGDYIVDWRALSRDGHLSIGRYGFSVGVASAEVGSTQGAVPALEATVRWVYLIALLVAFGALVVRLLTWAGLQRGDGRSLPSLPMVTLLEVAGAGALTQFGLVGRRFGFDLAQAPVQVALLQAVVVLVALALAMRAVRPRILLGTLGVAVVVAALGGHSATSSHWWAGPANAVHLLAVATWTGGLAQLLLAGWSMRGQSDQAALLHGARRYARFAAVSVLLAILTGVLSAAAEFGTLEQLVSSGYGRVLVFKVALVALALLMALGARALAIPRRRRWRPVLLRRLVRAESVALAAVLAAAALLANTAPPQAAAAAPEQVAVPVLAGPVLEQAEFDGRYLVRLRVNADTALVQLQDAAGRAPRDVHVDIFTVTPDYDDLNVFPRPCGPGCAAGDYPWQTGSTAVLVVSRAGGRETTVAFAVNWPPRASDPGALGAIRDRLAKRPQVTVREQVTTAAGTTPGGSQTVTGAGAVQRLGLDLPGLAALPYQGRPGTLLLAVPGGPYLELEFADDGSLSHELLIGPGGRTERFLG